MMIQFGIFVLMLVCAMLPFWLLSRLMRTGQSGLALTITSVIAATLVVFIYAGGGTFGVDPILAMALAMLICVPALLGCVFGALLGWLLRRRDDRGV